MRCLACSWRKQLLLALVVSSFVVLSESSVGLNLGGGKGVEKSTEYSKEKGQGESAESKENGDKTESNKSIGITVEDSKTEKDGNYSKTDSTGLNIGKDKTTTKDNKTGESDESNAYSVGYDKSTEHKVEKTAGDEKLHGEADASVKYGYEGGVSYGDEGVNANLGAGAEGHVHAGAGGSTDKIGDDNANVSFGAEGYVEAEVVAKIEGAIKANKDEISARLKAEAGVSAGIGGEVSADMELLGIPVTVKLAGEASVGAKVKGDIGVEYKDGKVRFIMEAGAVVGAGVEGKVIVEVGWDQVLKLANEVGGKIIDKTLSTFTDYDPDFINKIADAPLLSDKIKLIIQREIEQNKKWNNSAGDSLLQNVLVMIDKGADFETVYRYIKSLMSDDYESAAVLLQEIREQIEKQKEGGNGEGSGQVAKPEDDPFEAEPENDGNGQMCPIPEGGGSSGGGSSGGTTTGGKRPAPSTRVRRGGGGDTKAKIWP